MDFLVGCSMKFGHFEQACSSLPRIIIEIHLSYSNSAHSIEKYENHLKEDDSDRTRMRKFGSCANEGQCAITIGRKLFHPLSLHCFNLLV